MNPGMREKHLKFNRGELNSKIDPNWEPKQNLVLVRSMRPLAIFAIGLTLSACVSRVAVYQRSTVALHPDVRQSDFAQISEILSHHTHQPITSVKAVSNDKVMVHAAFPSEQDPGPDDDFVLAKRDGRWHILNATNIMIE